MSDWSSRAEAYRNAPEQREGADLELIVEWAQGSRTALDVATGGGHVARRLREAGLQVVSADPAPGMQPDVICRAEDLPFADGAFDRALALLVLQFIPEPELAVAEMRRVVRPGGTVAAAVWDLFTCFPLTSICPRPENEP